MYEKRKRNLVLKEYIGNIKQFDVWTGIIALLSCFLTIYYAGITVTGQFSLLFLDSLFTGNLINFYSDVLAIGIALEGTVYDIGVYAVFAIWILRKRWHWTLCHLLRCFGSNFCLWYVYY